MISSEQITQIKNRYPHETSEFIAQLLGISTSTVLKVARDFQLEKLNLTARNPSIEFIASYYNVDVNLLQDIQNNSKYKKPLPYFESSSLRGLLRRKFGTPVSQQKWDSIINELSLEQIDSIIENFGKYTNRALAEDHNTTTTVIVMIKNVYKLEKLPREQMFCDKCRVNHLPPRTYTSGNVCKECWTKRMSEYQYIYYPNKMANK